MLNPDPDGMDKGGSGGHGGGKDGSGGQLGKP